MTHDYGFRRETTTQHVYRITFSDIYKVRKALAGLLDGHRLQDINTMT